MRFDFVLRSLVIPVLVAVSFAGCHTDSDQKIAVTTSSEEARDLYLQARDLAEKLRLTDAHRVYQQAVDRDESFALGYLGLANTAPTNTEFFAALGKAVELVELVSPGERSMIEGLQAGVNNSPEEQGRFYSKLVGDYPDDERAHNLLGGYHFGRQEYNAAIRHYQRSNEINPEFSAPYNQLGYALRAVGRYDEAERAFRKYIELIPEEPNPYDSYAELLMKLGRFEESIENYHMALEKDANFVASYVGIGNNQMFMNDMVAARETLAKLDALARSDGEKRQAHFWTVASYLMEGNHAAALEAVGEMRGIAELDNDGAAISADHILMGNIRLDSGDPQGALEEYATAVEIIDEAIVPEERREQTRRSHLFLDARATLRMGDIEGARAKAEAYAIQVDARKIPFEVRRVHELRGLIALEEGNPEGALEEFAQANQQDPRVIHSMALAAQAKGDLQAAREFCERAANWNELNINYAYIRDDARQMLAQI